MWGSMGTEQACDVGGSLKYAQKDLVASGLQPTPNSIFFFFFFFG
jgi:hypothetical protein